MCVEFEPGGTCPGPRVIVEGRQGSCFVGMAQACAFLWAEGFRVGVRVHVPSSHIVGILVPACLSSPLSPSVDLKGRSPAIAPTGEAFALVRCYLSGGRAVMNPVRDFQIDRWVQKEFGPQL